MIRQWARDNGLPGGDRGRLSPQLLSAYAANARSQLTAAETKTVSTSARKARRQVRHAVRIPVQPTPGATGIAHKISALRN